MCWSLRALSFVCYIRFHVLAHLVGCYLVCCFAVCDVVVCRQRSSFFFILPNRTNCHQHCPRPQASNLTQPQARNPTNPMRPQAGHCSETASSCRQQPFRHRLGLERREVYGLRSKDGQFCRMSHGRRPVCGSRLRAGTLGRLSGRTTQLLPARFALRGFWMQTLQTEPSCTRKRCSWKTTRSSAEQAIKSSLLLSSGV